MQLFRLRKLALTLIITMCMFRQYIALYMYDWPFILSLLLFYTIIITFITVIIRILLMMELLDLSCLKYLYESWSAVVICKVM